MRVALLTDGIWPFVVGGMQKHSYMLCKYLTAQSITVILFHPEMGKDLNKHLSEVFTQKELSYLKWVNVTVPRKFKFPGHYVFESYLFSKNVFAAFKFWYKEVDFVYAKGLTSWYMLHKKMDIAQAIGINIHGYEFLQIQANTKEKLNAAMLYYPFKYINKKADFIFSYGGKVTHYIKELNVSSDKIIEIPGAIESAWVSVQKKKVPDVRRFVFIGRYERRKGIEELNKVIADLLNEYSFEFHFVGPVPDEIQFNHTSVVYHGLLSSRESIMQLLDDSDILVCPSYSEGMPNVILEAMARGCPVIATDVGAVQLLVNKETGWLIEPASCTALREAMISAIRAPMNQMISKSEKAVELIKSNYTWDQVGNTTAKVLEALVHE